MMLWRPQAAPARTAAEFTRTDGEARLRWYYCIVTTFYVQNFGCRATQADGAAIERQFEERGLERASGAASAAVVVLNTCTVTASADRDARAAIRRVHRENPQARIVVTGCYAQRSPEEIAGLPGVTQVIGNSHKHQLAEIAVAERSKPEDGDGGPPARFVPIGALTAAWDRSRRPIFISDIFAHTELLAAPVFDSANERTRPNLKVQDGCDNRCSFCVIPFVRGHSRSLRLEEVLREVNALVAAGFRELVISGINLGRWGRDLEPGLRRQGSGGRCQVSELGRRPTTDDRRLAFLVRSVLDCTSLEKLRISSVEPMDWSDELITLMADSPRIAKHAHVPLQSGSDAVLRRMRRKYRPWHYRQKIEKIRAVMPTAAIGADVMVGFPGETDSEFEATRCMVEELPFTYLHVFTYSARPGTPAAASSDQVPLRVARNRNRVLRELAAGKKLAFMRSFVGDTLEAITLASRSAATAGEGDRFTEALTDNYLSLRLQGNWEPNRWMRARIEAIHDGNLVGTVC
jgi:threonylcarbamoyladenosine tRNA methylthiotransferase MtaB